MGVPSFFCSPRPHRPAIRAKLFGSAAARVAGALISGQAGADYGDGGVGVAVDWGKLDEVIRDGTDSLERPLRSSVFPTETRLFGVSPHVSLIARDWGGAQLLVGRLSLTDQVRLSRSSRMFITRLRLA